MVLDQQRKIYLIEIWRYVETQIKIVALGEVRAPRTRSINDGNSEKFGQFDQRIERVFVSSDKLHKNEWTMRRAKLHGHAIDISGSGLRLRWRLNVQSFPGFGPPLDHRLHRNADVRGALWSALRKFSGAHDALIKGRNGRCLKGNFDHWLDKPLRSADYIQTAIPLGAGIEVSFAERLGLARQDEHRRLGEASAENRHAALEKAGAGMEQNGLHPARDLGVAGRHRNGESFMAAIKIGWTGSAGRFLAGERLP